jgi:hypothetical protein
LNVVDCPTCFAEAIRKNPICTLENYAELKAGEKSEGLDLDAALSTLNRGDEASNEAVAIS